MIEVARQMAVDNGLADRITFFQETSLRVDLPAQADVIISDIGGLLPHYGQHIPSIVDARERWLSADGVLIPATDTLRCAVVNSAETYASAIGVWEAARFSLDMHAARDLAVNSWHRAEVRADQLVSDVATLTQIDYATVRSPDLDAEGSLAISRPGTAHGLLVWFDRQVAPDVYLSNAPGAAAAVAPQHIYGTAFFPWSRPTEVCVGDRVAVRLRANAVDGDHVWRWTTSVTPPAATARETAKFSQSTFHATPISKRELRARAADYKPQLNQDGRIATRVLEMMKSQCTLDEIARRAQLEFPDRLTNVSEALHVVGELSVKFGM